MRLIQIMVMLFSGLVLGGCFAGGTMPIADQALSAPEQLGDGGVSDFYSYKPSLSAIPGVLLRQEPLATHQSIPGAAENIRLLYSSTDGLDGKTAIAVSGGLFLPVGTPPEAGWPLLLWSHGTVGIADVCAPSWTGYVPFHQEHLQQWLQNGYAIVASDYQGLGTEGTHPYLATRPAAYSNLDVIRAAQSAGFPLSKDVVILGQSQGAGAALATAGHASSYAPDISIRGVVTTGIPFFTPAALVAVQQARPRDKVDPMLGYNFLVLTLLEQLDPGFDVSDYVYEPALPIVRAVQTVCNRDMRKKIQRVGLTYNGTFKRPPPLEQGYEKMQYPTLRLAVPLFVGTGSIDRDTPPRMQARLVQAACKAGSSVSAHLYNDYDHLTALNRSLADSIPFVAAAFGGVGTGGNCDNLPY